MRRVSLPEDLVILYPGESRRKYTHLKAREKLTVENDKIFIEKLIDIAQNMQNLFKVFGKF
jgi:hypothetical protein